MSEREKTVQGLLNAAVEDETLRGWRLMGEAADTIERLIRERDALQARVKVLEDAGAALIADVKRRHPGEELHCRYMRALDKALEEGK